MKPIPAVHADADALTPEQLALARARIDLLTDAIVKYQFRIARPGETPLAYVQALITHVEKHDLSCGFELRIGKRQADWTAEDAELFRQHMTPERHGLPREDYPADHSPIVIPAMCTPGNEVSEANLLALADSGLQALCHMRGADPNGSIPIMANVLLTTGELLTAAIDRDDRVAFIKLLVRSQPVFGFFIVADIWVHNIALAADRKATGAQKGEAIAAQIGTRDRRLMKLRPYSRNQGRIIFSPTPPDDVDMKAEAGMTDAYASIFVSVPTPTGAPS